MHVQQPNTHCLVFGALAYDTLAGTEAPLDQAFQGGAASTASLNVKLDRLSERLGGCAGNIAYGFAQAGLTPSVCAVVGEDFAPRYAQQFKRHNLTTDGLVAAPGLCARALIFTAADQDQQLTAFYPGPDLPSHYPQQVRQVLRGHAHWCVIQAAASPAISLVNAGLTQNTGARIWNPGQYTAQFDQGELHQMLGWCDLLVANQQEWRWLCSQLERLQLATNQLPATIVTAGANPVKLQIAGASWQYPVPPAPTVCDPTGCGDAFVAGLLAYCNGQLPRRQDNWEAAIAQGIEFAGACLGQWGSQSYRV